MLGKRWRTVELTLGRFWWGLPLTLALLLSVYGVVVRILWFLWVQLDVGTPETSFYAAVIFGPSATIGVGYAASVLNARGARPAHRAASVGLVLLAAAVTPYRPRMMLDAAATLWGLMLLLLTLRTLRGWPRWRVRPSPRRKGSYSVGSIMLYTAAVAVLVALAGRHSPYGVSLIGGLFTALLVLPFVSLGQLMGCIANRTASRNFGVAIVTLLIVCGAICLAGTTGVAGGAAFVTFYLLAIVTPCWAICFLHRREPRVLPRTNQAQKVPPTFRRSHFPNAR